MLVLRKEEEEEEMKEVEDRVPILFTTQVKQTQRDP